MEKVYDLRQHTHCVIMHLGESDITVNFISTLTRRFKLLSVFGTQIRSSISYTKQSADSKKKGKYNVVINNFRDGLYNLFEKGKENDNSLMKALSDYLPLAVKKAIKDTKLEIESFNLFHYAVIVPSEWEEEIRDDIIRPIFVQSGLLSDEDHQDRLLFFSDIESICYGLTDERNQKYSFKRGQSTILCRLTPEKGKTIVKFDLIETKNTLFGFPNAKLFPKVTKSTSVTTENVERCIKEFLRNRLFPVATNDGGILKSLKARLARFYQDQVIKAIVGDMSSIMEEYYTDTELCRTFKERGHASITSKKRWMLSKTQKKFIDSLTGLSVCAEVCTFLFDDIKDIVSSNFKKSYVLLLFTDDYSNRCDAFRNEAIWLRYILDYNRRSLNSIVTITRRYPMTNNIKLHDIMHSAGEGVFEAIQHSEIYCKPHIMSSEDSATSSSVFLNSKPDAIVNLDISLGSTLFTCSLLNKDGLTRQIFDHDYFIADKCLPPLGHFYSFSDTTTLNVKEKFIPFAERYLLGDLVNFTVDDNAFMKDEIKAILTKHLSTGELLVSTNNPKYIKAFILMYMVYIKEEILNKLPDHSLSDRSDKKIGYAVSIEAMLLNDTMGTKDNLRDLIFASGLVPKGNDSKKLRITTQGEGILPAIQKSLKLEFTMRFYFLICQLHEDYIQLSLHQVVTVPTLEEKEQESIIVQDEIIVIPNIYDSLCKSMWHNIVQDSSLIELCKMHNTSDKSKFLDLFSSKTKKEFFDILRVYISDNVLQNNSDTESTMDTNAVKLNNSCNCKVRLTTADIIDVSFTPVLQDIACTLSGSLLNKEHFGNYINIDYLFSFIHFNNNPQLQCAFARILEEEADDFNLELGIDTCCLLVPQLFSQLIRPVISQQPLSYKDFKMGAFRQVCSENYAFSMRPFSMVGDRLLYKSKRTNTKTIESDENTFFPLLNKGEILNNVPPNRTFYLQGRKYLFNIVFKILRFKTMNYLENNETVFHNDNVHDYVNDVSVFIDSNFRKQEVDIPVMISIRYISYISSLQFSVKVVGTGKGDVGYTNVTETGEPLTLTRL